MPRQNYLRVNQQPQTEDGHDQSCREAAWFNTPLQAASGVAGLRLTDSEFHAARA